MSLLTSAATIFRILSQFAPGYSPAWPLIAVRRPARRAEFRTALLMLVLMPELGQMNRGGAAALAGLAPWTRDSGTMKGKRCIGGGRAQVRHVLYMSALSASRCNPVLAPFYRALKKRNKLSKVALTAVMRKLVVYMNHKLKALATMPPAQETKTATKPKKVLAN